MQCAKCNSEDVVTPSLVHAAGLSDVETRSRGPLWVFGDGGLLLGFGSTKAIGTSQTHLSKLAEPPPKKRYRHVILAWLIGLFRAGPLMDAFTASEKHSDTLLRQDFQTFAYVFSAVVVLGFVILWRSDHVTFPRRGKVWNRSFMCRCCGEMFQASAF